MKKDLSVLEVAKKLGVSTKTLKRWETKGLLAPTRTTGNHRRYNLSEVEKFYEKLQRQNAKKTKEISTERHVEMFDIKQASIKLGVSTKTLRRWETKGVLNPIRTDGNHRRYSLENLQAIRTQGVKEAFQRIAQTGSNYIPTGIVSTKPKLSEVLRADEQLRQDTKIEINKSSVPKAAFVSFAASIGTLGVIFLIVFLTQVFFSPSSSKPAQGSKGGVSFVPNLKSIGEVLAASTANIYKLHINVPTDFRENAKFLKDVRIQGLTSAVGGIDTENADVNAGTGKLTASNVIYSITAGTGITITPGQNPTISSSATGGVLSVNGATGVVNLTAGSGITISGTTISNSAPGPGASVDSFSNIVSGSTTITASGNDDTLTFTAGSGINITPNSGDKSLTFSMTGGGTGDVVGPGSSTDNAIVRFDGATGKLIQNSGVIIDDLDAITGVTGLTVAGAVNLTSGNSYQINGTSVLDATTLGTGVLNSSLTSVGALMSGSIANGFGTIITANTITGTTLNGTTGINTGVAAGTQRVDASGNLVNINNITAGGTITFSGFSGQNGGVLYANGSGVTAQTVAGTSLQCLLGGAIPFFGSCNSGENSDAFWNQANGLLFTNNSTVDFAIGGQASSSAKFAVLNIAFGTPTASVSGSNGALFITANGNLATTNNQNLTIGGSSTGNITFSPQNGSGTSTFNGTFQTIGTTNLGTGGSPINLNGSSINLAGFTSAGGVLYTTGLGALAQTSSGTNTTCLIGGASPSWGSCSTGVSSDTFWNQQAGLLFPNNSTVDFALGGQATTSAKFSVLNMNTGTPTASISAVTTGLTLGGDGTIQSLRNGNLSLGGSTTGNVFVNSDGAGNLSVGTTSIGSQLTVGGIISAVGGNAFGINLTTTPTAVSNSDVLIGTRVAPTIARATSLGSLTTYAMYVDGTGDSGSSTVTNAYGQRIDPPDFGTNRTGLYITTPSGGTNNYAALLAGGQMGLGTTTPSAFASLTIGAGSVSPTGSNIGIAFDDGALNALLGVPGTSGQYSTNSTTDDFVIRNVIANTGNILLAVGASGTEGIRLGADLKVGIGTNGAATSELQVSRPLSFGATGKALAIFDQIENQDIFTASKSGVTKFTIGQNGEIGLGATAGTPLFGSASQCLLSGGTGSLPTWGSCAIGNGTNWWTTSSDGKALTPVNSTMDLLLGSQATTSAKFAVLNLAGSLTPTASISANSGNNATFLTGTGNLATTNGQTLTLGGATTGNIIVNPRNAAAGGYFGPSADNVTDLGASPAARFRSLYVGPSSLHVQCRTGDGCGQGLDYALGINTSTGTFSVGVNGTTATGNPLLNITQGGNVGIGTTTPLSLLHVAGAMRATNYLDADNTSFFLDPASSTTSLAVNGNITSAPTTGNFIGWSAVNAMRWDSSFGPFMNSSANFVINIDADNDNPDNTSFAVSKNAQTSTGGTPLLTVLEGGNVGIGTSAPSSIGEGGTPRILQIHNTGSNAYGHLILSGDTVTNGEVTGIIDFGTTGASSAKRTAAILSGLSAAGGTNATGFLAFYTNNAGTVAERMRITSSGEVDFNNNIGMTNGTSNTLFFGTNGIAAPGAVSAGEKIQLYGTSGTVSSSDYALGIEGSNMWFNTGGGYKWYLNSARMMSLDGSSTQTRIIGAGAYNSYGALTVAGDKNGWSGIGFQNSAGTYQSSTFMVLDSAGTRYQGSHNETTALWDWLWQNGTLTQGTVPAAHVSAGAFGAGSYSMTGSITATSFLDADNTGYFLNPAATGNSLLVAGTIATVASGNQLGAPNGSYISPTNANTNILLYNNSSTNWAGIGADTGGVMYFVTGTSAPATRALIDTAGIFYLNTATPFVTHMCAATNGTTQQVGFCSSDARIKHDISYIDGQTSGLDAILSLKPAKFVGNTDGIAHAGFIAQDVTGIIPEAAYKTAGSDYYVFDPDAVLSYAVKAIQEQQLEIEGLQNSIPESTFDNYHIESTSLSADPIYADYQVKDENNDVVNKVDAFAKLIVGEVNGGKISVSGLSAVKAKIDNLIVTANASISGTLNTSSLSAQEATVGSLLVNSDATISGTLNTQDLIATAVSADSLTINTDVHVNGTLYADKIKANQIEGLSYFLASSNEQLATSLESTASAALKFAAQDNKISSISAQVQGIVDQLANVGFTGFASNSGSLTTVDNLMVSGSTSLSDLSVLNQLSIGNNLTIGSNYIDSGDPGSEPGMTPALEIQPLGRAGVNFLGGKIVFDTEGNIKVEENAEFAKDVKVGGVLSAATIKVPKGAIVNDTSTESTASSSAGISHITAGQTERKINTPSAKSDSVVIVTPNSSTQGANLYVKSKTNGSFTVGIDSTLNNDLEFNFLIINQ